MGLDKAYNVQWFEAVWVRQEKMLMELVDKLTAGERRVGFEVCKEAVRESTFHCWQMARRAEPRHNEDGVSRFKHYEAACRMRFAECLPQMTQVYEDSPEQQKLMCLKLLAIRKTSFVLGWRAMRDLINQLLEDQHARSVEGRLNEVAQEAVDHWLKVELAEPDFG